MLIRLLLGHWVTEIYVTHMAYSQIYSARHFGCKFNLDILNKVSVVKILATITAYKDYLCTETTNLYWINVIELINFKLYVQMYIFTVQINYIPDFQRKHLDWFHIGVCVDVYLCCCVILKKHMIVNFSPSVCNVYLQFKICIKYISSSFWHTKMSMGVLKFNFHLFALVLVYSLSEL